MAWFPIPQVPETDPTKIIRPNRLRCMLRDARCATRNAPVRFASMTVSNRSSVIRIRNASAVMPALETNTSTAPWCSSTAVKARSTASLSVTSHSTANNPSGTPEPRWVTATWCPSAARRRAIARPIPRLPPVTRTDRATNPGLGPVAWRASAVSLMGSTYRLTRTARNQARGLIGAESAGQAAIEQQCRQRRQG